jgi:hypothetical protein
MDRIKSAKLLVEKSDRTRERFMFTRMTLAVAVLAMTTLLTPASAAPIAPQSAIPEAAATEGNLLLQVHRRYRHWHHRHYRHYRHCRRVCHGHMHWSRWHGHYVCHGHWHRSCDWH